MKSHAPENYHCPFCHIVSGKDTEHHTVQEDIIYKDKIATAWISSRTWSGVEGNVIIVPNEHFENLYDIPDKTLAHITILSKKIACAMKSAYRCDGVSTRQHNEPAGGQDVWHYHLHVFPRTEGDNLYLNTEKYRDPTKEERLPFANKLKEELRAY